MNGAVIRFLCLNELRMMLRDRRTIFLAVVLPLFLMPLTLFGFKIVNEQREKKLSDTVYRYAVSGAQADTLRAQLRTYGTAAAIRDSSLREVRFEEVLVASPDSSLRAGDIHFHLVVMTFSESDSAEQATKSEKRRTETKIDTLETFAETRYPGVPTTMLRFFANRDISNVGARHMYRMLATVRSLMRETSLRNAGFVVSTDRVIPVTSNDTATGQQVAGSLLGRFIPLLLVFLMMSGGSVAAMDSIAGEKEHGMLETLLTTAVSRFEIVLAKQVTVLVVTAAIVFIQAINLLVYVYFRFIPLPENMALALSPTTLLLLVVLFVPTASVVSSILLMISAYAKTYKETQWYYFPAFLCMAFQSGAALLPSLPLRSAAATVPIAGVSLATREILAGRFDWLMLAIAVAAAFATAALLLRATTRMLSMERLISASEWDKADLTGGPALFPKRVLLWFGGMWAVMLIAATNMTALMKLEGQWVFNMFVLFTATPLLMMKIYRLEVKTALALRPVKPFVWLLTVLAIPALHLTGIAVLYLAGLVFPVSEKMIEEFTRSFVPGEYPLWKILLMLSVVPGIVEEIAFRGVLLHGLHRRFHPVVVALLVGLVFGLFHLSLFRIVPTGFMGIVLAGMALATGSIFPCMLIHAGNNALSLTLYHYGIHTENLVWEYYALGMTAFVLCGYLIYRNRTPYPGLRPTSAGREADSGFIARRDG
ncbi:MAG: CPBP family intramembrane metalloprotease [candidate division Zixibacteria bacterium]|nr:CPBP family intramembrane metalloprotease [candidate division Zixibacteria bacterium]